MAGKTTYNKIYKDIRYVWKENIKIWGDRRKTEQVNLQSGEIFAKPVHLYTVKD